MGEAPHFFQCSACRKRKGWPPERNPHLWRKGLIPSITLTGKAKPVNDGKATRGRSANTRFEYKCNDCGHVGWTRHWSVLTKARNEGIPTPGEEGLPR